jgi:glycosyltransferase involved in cell wall biosynthesis
VRIGIDARPLCAPKTGDRTYLLGLLEGLARVGADHEVILYFDQPPPADVPFARGWQTRVVTAPHPRLWTPLTLPDAARVDRCDVLHVQYIAPTCRRPRVVTTIHDVTFRLHPEWFPLKDRLLLDWGIRKSLRTVAAIITGSECTRQDLARVYGVPPERVALTPYAVSPTFRPPADQSMVQDVLARHGIKTPYALFVGVLQPRKNLPRLISAFRIARERAGLPHRLVIAGKVGWKAAPIVAAIQQAEAAGHAQYVGYVPDVDLPALYGGAAAFLFPTLYEGFGLPVLEALACGTPTLTSNVSALPEVAGDAALLADPTDEPSLADAIIALLTDESLRARLAAAGPARARQFTWERTAQLTLECYREVAGN